LKEPSLQSPNDAVGANTSNGFSNTCGRLLDYMETRREEVTPSQLAKELALPGGTVRWNLQKLHKSGKVIQRRVGIYSFYCASKQFSDDFTRLYKMHGATEKYQVHGLTLKLEGDFSNYLSNTIPLGGAPIFGSVVRWFVGYLGRRVSFQLSRGVLMCWVDCSLAPLDYDEFLLFLCFVDGHLAGVGLPTMRGDLGGWRVVQYGLNKDYRVFRNDSPTSAVSLKGFSDWFARCYEKKFPDGSTKLREELHGTEPKRLEDFVGLISGGLTSVQILNAIYVYAQGVNSLQHQVSELIKRFDRLERERRAET
jgi:hypothetical protein